MFPTNTFFSQNIISKILTDTTFTLQCKLDIIDVLLGLRPAARLIVKKNIEAEALATILIDSGGYVKPGSS